MPKNDVQLQLRLTVLEVVLLLLAIASMVIALMVHASDSKPLKAEKKDVSACQNAPATTNGFITYPIGAG